MTKTAKAKAYDAKYESTPEQKHKRAERNKARRELEREGVVHKGDGKEVDHKRPLGAGGSNDRSNLRAIDAEKNRGWRKGESGYKPKKV